MFVQKKTKLVRLLYYILCYVVSEHIKHIAVSTVLQSLSITPFFQFPSWHVCLAGIETKNQNLFPIYTDP